MTGVASVEIRGTTNVSRGPGHLQGLDFHAIPVNERPGYATEWCHMNYLVNKY